MVIIFLIFLSLTSASLYKPEQVRLSWTENENEMLITWVTYIKAENFAVFRPILCPNISAEWISVLSNTETFNEGEIIIRYQYIHSALVTNLRPECYYEYYVHNALAKSDLFIFSGRTPDNQEPFQDAENPLTMIIYGDLGIGSNAVFVKYLLEKEVKMREFLGIIHMGDIAYNMDQDDGIVGDTFFNMIQPLSANFAYMPTIGNHENKANSTHFKARFKLPKNKANQGTGYFYSYNLGAAHFIHISTELYTDDNKKESAMTQNNWLKQDLIEANNNRHIRPWIIVLTHHPLYCSVIHRECVEEAEMFQDILEDLWFDYGVDLMLEAHIHNYERDTPIYKNKTVKSQYDDYNTHINADATLYIVSGNAGNRKGHNDPVPKLKKDWAVYMTEDYGYGRLQVFNKTHMLWVQYSAINLTTIDHVWLIKDRLRFNNK